MAQHFNFGSNEPSGWLIHSSVTSYRLYKGIVEFNEIPEQMDRLDLVARILSPNELRGHRIKVELWKKREPQISVVEGYKGIGKLFFMPSNWGSKIESGQIARGHFAVRIDVGFATFDDLVHLLVSLEGKRSVARGVLLQVIGLLNHWDLEGDLPLLNFRLTVRSRHKRPQKQQVRVLSDLKLIPPLVSHDDDD